MSLPEIVTRGEWISARVALLEREKALTKARDELATERRGLPMRLSRSPWNFGDDGPRVIVTQ
jgi:predicted dithiol-disulfide oxidoreductase (DUF899 family)